MLIYCYKKFIFIESYSKIKEMKDIKMDVVHFGRAIEDHKRKMDAVHRHGIRGCQIADRKDSKKNGRCPFRWGNKKEPEGMGRNKKGDQNGKLRGCL